MRLTRVEGQRINGEVGLTSWVLLEVLTRVKHESGIILLYL